MAKIFADDNPPAPPGPPPPTVVRNLKFSAKQVFHKYKIFLDKLKD